MQDNQDFIRGRRAEQGLIDWSDCQMAKEEIDKIIEPFCSKDIKEINQEIYVSSKKQ